MIKVIRKENTISRNISYFKKFENNVKMSNILSKNKNRLNSQKRISNKNKI